MSVFTFTNTVVKINKINITTRDPIILLLREILKKNGFVVIYLIITEINTYILIIKVLIIKNIIVGMAQAIPMRDVNSACN